MNNFIVDFYSREKNLVIEVDGEIHNSQKERDVERDLILSEKFGLKIIRFTNNDIMINKEFVEKILFKALH